MLTIKSHKLLNDDAENAADCIASKCVSLLLSQLKDALDASWNTVDLSMINAYPTADQCVDDDDDFSEELIRKIDGRLSTAFQQTPQNTVGRIIRQDLKESIKEQLLRRRCETERREFFARDR
ncbi:MAG: hypothetical protein NTW52_08160 [Planctomycetota bacterium]|nr:hypothetical protein [Planctomycetota bacterium]